MNQIDSTFCAPVDRNMPISGASQHVAAVWPAFAQTRPNLFDLGRIHGKNGGSRFEIHAARVRFGRVVAKLLRFVAQHLSGGAPVCGCFLLSDVIKCD